MSTKYNLEHIIEDLKVNNYTKFINPLEFKQIKNKININKYNVYKPFEDCSEVIIYKTLPDITLLRLTSVEEIRHQEIMKCMFELGIKEDMYGDIVIKDNNAYIYMLPSIKDYILYNFKDYNRKIQDIEEIDIESLNDYEINCDVDYGLRGFEISVSDDCFKTIVYCNALKATYTSKLTFQTSPKYSGSFNIDGFFDVLVGRTDQENDVDIGYPLRGFKFVVYPSRDRRDPTVCFLYGYSKLKNMAVVADAYKKKFEEIRNTNNQKN